MERCLLGKYISKGTAVLQVSRIKKQQQLVDELDFINSEEYE